MFTAPGGVLGRLSFPPGDECERRLNIAASGGCRWSVEKCSALADQSRGDVYVAIEYDGQRWQVAEASEVDPGPRFGAAIDIGTTTVDELIIDLSQKLRVTILVVTHEMDSAFRIADRMVMLEKGRILRAAAREEFERLRDTDAEALESDEERLIRQFLRGDARGRSARTRRWRSSSGWCWAGQGRGASDKLFGGQV